MLERLTALAIDAGLAIRAIAATSFDQTAKNDGSPVTQADLAADRIIVEGLAKIAPQVPVVSEESADFSKAPGDLFFLVDPLDGTKEFVAGRAEYTVNIALVSGGVPVLGIVGAPAMDLLWRGVTALPGAGWTARAERLALSPDGAVQSVEAIHVRPRPDSTCIAAISRSHPDANTAAYIAALGNAVPLEAGSALKFCWVAEGRADLYPRLAQTSEWDVAAGAALVVAAGGRVQDGEGGALRFGHHEAQFRVPGFIAEGAPKA
jgi:3'(2'), 5'-bisphosphate nucleotidase